VHGGFVEDVSVLVEEPVFGPEVEGKPLVSRLPLKTMLNFFILTIFYN